MSKSDGPAVVTPLDRVRAFVLREFLDGEDPGMLKDDTPLITGGIIDSIDNVRLVQYLEEEFHISLCAAEVSIQNLDTIDSIMALVANKSGQVSSQEAK